jgi:DNA polymerase III epsilon subunit-like protein
VACVIDDTDHPEIPVDDLPSWCNYVQHDELRGDPMALAMNRNRLEAIAKGAGLPPTHIYPAISGWLERHGLGTRGVTAAGKNFSGFDRIFLNRMDDQFVCLFHHRSIDPTVWFWEKDDLVLPSMSECCKRAGIPYEGTHDALDDARLVIQLVRKGMEKP